MRKLLFVFWGMLICSPVSAVMVTFTPDATYIRGDSFADTAMDSFDPTLINSDFATPPTRMLIRDDSIFPTVPLGATIDSATLELDKFNGTVGDVDVHQVLTAWAESTVTWNSFNGGGVAGTDFVSTPAATYSPGTSSSGTNVIDVTSIVQAWSNGAANEGFYLVNGSNDGVTYRSDDATVGAVPALTINYSTAVIPEPSAFALLGLVACCFGARKIKSWKKS